MTSSATPFHFPFLYLLGAWMHSRRFRILALMLSDAAIVAVSYIVAFWFRFDVIPAPPADYFTFEYILATLPWLLAIRLTFGWVWKMYHWSFGHASLSEGGNICLSVLFGTLLFIFLGHVMDAFPKSPPRSIYALEAAMSLAGMALIRFFPKYLYIFYLRHYPPTAGLGGVAKRRTLIYGAGGNAELLARELSRTNAHEYSLVGFLDDNPSHWSSRIHGFQVLGGIPDLPRILGEHDIEQILVAAPGLSGKNLRALVDLCGPRQVTLKSVPSYNDLLTSRTAARKLEDIRPDALLDRQAVDFDPELMANFLAGKTVMVTGAAGSIGSELCRQAAGLGAGRLVLYDINENELYFLLAELADCFPGLETSLEMGSIQDRRRLDEVMGRLRPEVVFHAAAHKHVSLMEASPAEALKNNVLGSHQVADCALAHGVGRFVMISTDKAIASSSVMGASKRLAERVARAMGRRGGTRFISVRFGNVLGSNGSLLEIVRRQIAKGGPVTVTHRDMIRYFMTIPEAVGLVLVAAALDEGEVCVLDMGEPVQVETLVRQTIYLAGLVPDRDIEVRHTRPRPGEKLREEICSEEEQAKPSSFPRINIVDAGPDDFDLDRMLADARAVAESNRADAAKAFFRRWVADYRPG